MTFSILKMGPSTSARALARPPLSGSERVSFVMQSGGKRRSFRGRSLISILTSLPSGLIPRATEQTQVNYIGIPDRMWNKLFPRKGGEPTTNKRFVLDFHFLPFTRNPSHHCDSVRVACLGPIL